jgi:hypothetical protein
MVANCRDGPGNSAERVLGQLKSVHPSGQAATKFARGRGQHLVCLYRNLCTHETPGTPSHTLSSISELLDLFNGFVNHHLVYCSVFDRELAFACHRSKPLDANQAILIEPRLQRLLTTLLELLTYWSTVPTVINDTVLRSWPPRGFGFYYQATSKGTQFQDLLPFVI